MIKMYRVTDRDRHIIGYASSESRNKAKGYISKATKTNYKDLLVNRVYEKSEEFLKDFINEEGNLLIKQANREFYKTNIKEL